MVAKKKVRSYKVTTGAEVGKFALWPAGGRTWHVMVEWDEIDGRYEPVAVMLRSCQYDAEGEMVGLPDLTAVDPELLTIPTQPPFAITAQLVRSMKLGDLLDDMRRRQLDNVESSARSRPEDAERLGRYAEHWGGRRGVRIEREALERAAEIYREAFHARRPTRAAIAKAFHINESTAAKWVRKCRDAGLLGPTTPGKAGEAS